jgi:hypothetical protein
MVNAVGAAGRRSAAPSVVEIDHDVWESAAWYRALFLTERLALPDRGSRSRVPGVAADRERAEARLATWKTQTPFRDEAVWAQRLALDALSEAGLRSLLGESAETLKARTPAAPAWLGALRSAYTRPAAAEPAARVL